MSFRRSHSTRAIRVHTSATLDPQLDVTRRDGLPITTPSRTLVDSAPLLDDHELERVCHEAAFLEIVDRTDLDRLLDAGPPGARKLRAALASLTRTGPQITRSELEDRFLSLLARHDLPRPLVNFRLHGYTVDFLWPAHRLVVETDGRNHLRPALFESARERDGVLQLHGYRVIRFTWRQIIERPGHVVRMLDELLASS